MNRTEVKAIATHFGLTAKTQDQLWTQLEQIGLTIGLDMVSGEFVVLNIGDATRTPVATFA